MSINVSNTLAAKLHAMSPGEHQQKNVDVNKTLMNKMEEQHHRANHKIEETFERATVRTSKVEELANANDYSHLATIARNVKEGLDNAEQNLTTRIDNRFEVKEELVENRPTGGYSINEEDATALSENIQQRRDTQMSNFTEKTANISEKLGRLEQHAIGNGHDGTQINSLAEKVENRRDTIIERRELHTDKMLTMIERRINETYNTSTNPILTTET